VIILATPGITDEAGTKAFCESLGDLSGKIILDATNPLGPFQEGLNVCCWGGDGMSGGELMAKYLSSSKVYKTFNTVGVEHMAEAFGKDMFIAGDADEEARAIAEGVVAAVGFKPFYVGYVRSS
jgi:predicted dinucleotide-binding enzyme